jgi:hypothetical protein
LRHAARTEISRCSTPVAVSTTAIASSICVGTNAVAPSALNAPNIGAPVTPTIRAGSTVSVCALTTRSSLRERQLTQMSPDGASDSAYGSYLGAIGVPASSAIFTRRTAWSGVARSTTAISSEMQLT